MRNSELQRIDVLSLIFQVMGEESKDDALILCNSEFHGKALLGDKDLVS